MKLIFIWVFVLLSFGHKGKPMFATYYMSPSGNDGNAGTIGSPWLTLEGNWTDLNPGDILYVRGGTYEFLNTQDLTGGNENNGTAGNLIKIWNYPGETPIFTDHASFDVPGGEWDLIYVEGDYHHWKGIEIANYEQRSGENAYSGFKYVSTNNSIFEQINYHHNGSAFKIAGPSNGNLILNCDFHNNSNPFAPDAWGGADGLNIGVTNDSNPSSVNTIRGCRAWWNSDDGFDAWWQDGYVLFDSCFSWYNGYRPGTFTAGGDGTGFKLGETVGSYFSTLKRTVQNCVAFENKNIGISENDLKAKSNIYNNTVIGSGVYGFYYGQFDVLAIGTLTNNISYDQSDNIAAHVVETTNSWQGFTVTDADFISIDPASLDDPRKADGSLPEITFFHLALSSDLRIVGTNLSLPGWRNPPDLGAFQSNISSPNIIQFKRHAKIILQ